MKYVWVYLVLFGIIVLTAWAVYAWMPDYRGYLEEEDSLVENLSAFLYFGAFFLGLLFFVKGKKDRKALIILSAVGLLAFLDEVSFGERLFALNMPHIGNMKIDGAHDFFVLAYTAIERLAHTHAILVYLLLGLGALVAVAMVLKYRYRVVDTVTHIHHKQTCILALIFAFLVFSSLMIDVGLVRNRALFALEELLEMNAAIALIFCCWSCIDPGLSKDPPVNAS